MTVRNIIRTILVGGLLVSGLTSARAQSDIKGDVYFLDPSKAFKAQLVAPSGMSNDVVLTLPGQSGTLMLIGGGTAQGGFDRATYLFNVAYGSGTGNATGALITSATTTIDASARGLDIIATANGTGTSTALKLTANGATTDNYALEIAAGGIKISSTLPTAVSSTQPLVLEGGVVKIGTGSGHTGSGTANTIAMWTGATALGNSMLSQNPGATIFTVAGRETITATSNQLVLGTTNTITLSATAPAASLTYTFPDVGADADVVLTEGTQTINGLTNLANTTTLKTNNELRFENTAGTFYTGFKADALQASSFTYTLPLIAATGNQVLRANNATPTTLEWVTIAQSDPGTISNSTLYWNGTKWTENTNVLAPSTGDVSVNTVTVLATTNQLVLGTTNTVTINSPATAANRVYSLPVLTADAAFVMTEGAQTINGAKTLTGTTIIGSTTATTVTLNGTALTPNVTMTSLGGTARATTPVGYDRVVLANSAGLMDEVTLSTIVQTTGAQTIAGAKTFSSAVAITPTTNQLVLGTTNTTTLSATAPAASRTYTFPDALANANVVLTEGTQTINGLTNLANTTTLKTNNELRFENTAGTFYTGFKAAGLQASSVTYTLPLLAATGNQVLRANNTTPTTLEWVTIAPSDGGTVLNSTLFWNGTKWTENTNVLAPSTGDISVNTVTARATTNQLVLGSTNTVTINSPATAANRIYSLPVLVADASFVMTEGAQTINGAKTLTGTTIIGSATATTVTLNGTALTPNVTVTSLGGTARAASPGAGYDRFVIANSSGQLEQAALGTFVWSLSGNATTTAWGGASGSYLGTTSAQPLSIATTNATAQDIRFYTGASGANLRMTIGSTGLVGINTTPQATYQLAIQGNVKMVDATTSTISANKELILEQTGDTFGTSRLRIQHRNGSNGALFETAGTVDLVDFGMKPGAGVQSNIRLEARPSSLINSAANTTGEFQFLMASTTAPVYALTLGQGSATFNAGVVGIGDPTPDDKFTVGTTSQFRVSATGDITMIKNLAYVWPSSHVAGVLVNNGSGTLTWTAGGPIANGVTTNSTLRWSGTAWIENANVLSGATGTLSLAATTNQLVLGTTRTVTINAPTPAANATYSIPDVGATASFVMTESAQTINGAKTLTGTTIIGSAAAATVTLANATGSLTVNGTALTPNVTMTSLGGTARSSTPVGYDRVVLASSTGSLDEVALSTIVQTSGAQTIAGAKTFSSAVAITPTTNQLILGTGTTTTINAPAPAANAAYTIPDVGTTASFVMTEGTQTINGAKTLTGTTVIGSTAATTVTLANATGSVTVNGTALTPNVTLTSLGGTARASMPVGYDRIVLANSSGQLDQAAIATVLGTTVWSLTGNATASAWNGTTGSFLGTTSAQPLSIATTNATAQDIRFYTGVSGASERMRINATGEVGIGVTSASGQLLTVHGTAGTPNITFTELGGTAKASTPVGYDRVVVANSTGSLDEVALSTFVQTSGAQTIAGAKTFSSALTITPTTNQLVLGTTNTVTINSPATAANRVYSLPLLVADASFVMTEGAQTINGNTTISGTTNLSALTASLPLKLDASKNVTAAGIDLTSATEVLNTLPVNRGGTSFSTYAQGDLLYASAANTLSKLPIGLNGQYLTITSGLPAWASGSIMQYDVPSAQNTSVTAANWLFNVQYGTITGAATGARIASVTTAANSSATGLTLIATATGSGTATALSLAATAGTNKYALTVADGSGFSGFGTTAPTHVVHAVNSATTDELAGVYTEASGSTSNQAIGVWGDASNNAAGNTGSIGVLATGSGRTTTAETNAAVQIVDGEIRVGRTTQTGTGYTVVEAATAGTAYTAEGPSGVIEVNLGTVGGWVDNGNISNDKFRFTTVTVNNRFVSTNSIVLLSVIDKVDVVVNNTVNPTQAVFVLEADNRAAGSFLLQIGAQLRSGAADNNNPFSDGDKIRIGYMVVNPSR